MEPFTLEMAVRAVFSEIENKIKQGKFVKWDEDFDWDNEKLFEGGDPESIYTLLSLYGQFLTEEDRDKLGVIVQEKYPDY